MVKNTENHVKYECEKKSLEESDVWFSVEKWETKNIHPYTYTQKHNTTKLQKHSKEAKRKGAPVTPFFNIFFCALSFVGDFF